MLRSLGSTRRPAGERHGDCEINAIDPSYCTVGMAMGKRPQQARQASMCVATRDLPQCGLGLPPGRDFRLLLIGYFEGSDAERAIAWRAADSFALREFLGLVLPKGPDHSTISRTASRAVGFFFQFRRARSGSAR